MATGTSGWAKIAHGDRTVWLFQPDREVWLQHAGGDPAAAECDTAEADLVGRVVDAVEPAPAADAGQTFTAHTADGSPVRDAAGGTAATYRSVLAAAAALADDAIRAGA